MKTQLQVGQAITGEFLARKITGARLLCIIVSITALLGCAFLVHLNAWWLLLALPVIFLILSSIALLAAASVLITTLRPAMTPAQATAVSAFVDKFERTSEVLGTPPFIIVIKIVWDVAVRRRNTYVMSIARDGTTLHSDLLALQKQF